MTHLSRLFLVLSFFFTSIAHADSPAVVLADFKSDALDFLYGSWSGMLQSSEQGIIMGGEATAKGGGGSVIEEADLSGLHGLSVQLRVLPGNKASGFNILLFSKGEKASGYSFTLPGPGENATTMIVDLKKPFFKPEGAVNGHADLSEVIKFQIQGNYKDSAPLAVEFQLIEAVPPKP